MPERWHPDGELLHLVDGAVDIILDEAAGERCLGLQPGQAFVVPCGVFQIRTRMTLCELRRYPAPASFDCQAAVFHPASFVGPLRS
jgi:hypothetical protein